MSTSLIARDDILLTEAQIFARGLRELAVFYERYQGCPLPPEWSRSLSCYSVTPLQISQIARAEGALETEKEYQETRFTLKKKFSGGLSLEFNCDRNEVCEKVVTGTKEVPERIIPAHTEEVVEWRCKPILQPPAPAELPAQADNSAEVLMEDIPF